MTHLVPEGGTGTRLAELVASLSFATDLGRGQPMEHSIRRARLGLRLADLLGADDDDRIATYYTGLLDGVYCHADANEQAMWFGDDIAVKAEHLCGGYGVAERDPDHAAQARCRRVRAWLACGGSRSSPSWLGGDESMAQHALRPSGSVRDPHRPSDLCQRRAVAVLRALGRKGRPERNPGRAIPLAARIVCLADVVEVYHHSGGIEAGREVASERSGGEFDPHLARASRERAADLLEGLKEETSWSEVIGAEPGLDRMVSGDELDVVLEAMADLVDLKSPHMAGHSRGVANLAAEAARVSGMPEPSKRRSGAPASCTTSAGSASPTRSGTSPGR